MVKEMLAKELHNILGFDNEMAEKLATSFAEDYPALRLSQGIRSKAIASSSIPQHANGMSVIYEIFLLEALTFYDNGKKDDKLKELI